MTKEAVLAPYIRMTDAATHWVYAEDAIVAMDEYAKQQAIAFDIWKIRNHWLWDNSVCRYFKWEGDNTHETRLSHEEIYSRFIEQQKA